MEIERASLTELGGERNDHFPEEVLTGFQQCCQDFGGCPGERERKVKKSMFNGLFVSPWIPKPAGSLLPPHSRMINQRAGILLIAPLTIKEAQRQNCSKQSVCLENGSQESRLLLKIPSPPHPASHLPPPSLPYAASISAVHPCPGSCQSLGFYLGTLATLEGGLGGAGAWAEGEPCSENCFQHSWPWGHTGKHSRVGKQSWFLMWGGERQLGHDFSVSFHGKISQPLQQWETDENENPLARVLVTFQFVP